MRVRMRAGRIPEPIPARLPGSGGAPQGSPLVEGELPFRGTPRMVLQQILGEEPRSPRRLNDRIPRDLETITLKCLAKEPGRRYATAAGLAADLRRLLAGEPIVARP